MKKFLFLLATFSLLTFFAAKTVSADTTCTPIYGGGQNCVTTGNIAISKTVQNPQTNGFVTNLTINDPKFSVGQTITFQVTVTNNDSNASSITIVDNFPQFFQFNSGPGSFDNNAQTLTWQATGLAVGQSQTFTIQGKVTGNIPLGNTCEFNQVAANSNNGDSASANSQFCIVSTITTTKGGLLVVSPAPVKTTPPTGPEALPLLALIPGALAGFGLIKKSNKS
jgi:uncharacterized repeat protein (TIGR01451 family)